MRIIDVTLNPNNIRSGLALSNNNLTVTSTNVAGPTIKATHGKKRGKWYLEAKLDSGTNVIYLGVTNISHNLAGGPLTGSDLRYYYGLNGNKFPENLAYASSLPSSGVVGLLINMDAGTLEFSINGIRQGVSHTNLLDLVEVFPTFRSGSSGVRVVTFNFGATPFTYPLPDGYIPYNREYSNKILLYSGDKYYSYNSDEISEISPMSSNTSSIGEVITIDNSTSGYLTFNNNFTDGWSKTFQVGDWIGFRFNNSKIINKYFVSPRAGSNYYIQMPKDWLFQGRNLNSDWISLDKRIGEVFTNAEGRYYSFSNYQPFDEYRLFIEANGTSGTLSIGEVQMYSQNDVATIVDYLNESNFLQYGMDDVLALGSPMRKIISVASDRNEEKDIFTHTIDLSKRRVDKITLS